MNAGIFAEWLRRQGRHVIRSTSSYWYDAGPRVFQAFPYHWQLQPSASELRLLTLGHAIAALRYSTPITAPLGKISYHVVLQRPYTLDMLRAQARNGVRRGLSSCRVEQISFERLAVEGWSLQADTLERQGRTRAMTLAEWQRICRAAEGLPGFEAWGAVVGEELAASLLVARIDDTWCVPYALSHSKYLREHVNNALFFTASTELLGREGVARIFFTLQSLDAPESVDEFKFRMGLAAVPVRQRVVFNPCLEPFATGRTHAFLCKRVERDPGNPTLAKAEGMLRFCLQGRRAAELQEWPACLADCRADLIQQAGPAAGQHVSVSTPVAVRPEQEEMRA